jgi:hypothetical protein
MRKIYCGFFCFWLLVLGALQEGCTSGAAYQKDLNMSRTSRTSLIYPRLFITMILLCGIGMLLLTGIPPQMENNDFGMVMYLGETD